ncbi:Late competence protein ComEA, DNA receptor [uncultured Candidatus Thioglobus sp.]|nr:Late competence protein ComEA, DNA receptor [uncultured Candidatus Thioglobus sp.]
MRIFKKVLIAVCLLIPTFIFAETVNINTADKETLMMFIKGVGEVRAEAIITYREENGAFKSVEELTEVRGIGVSILKKNMDMLAISGESSIPEESTLKKSTPEESTQEEQ